MLKEWGLIELLKRYMCERGLGRRLVGGQQKKWIDSAKYFLKKKGLKIGEARRMG